MEATTATAPDLLGPTLRDVSRAFYLTLRVLPAGMREVFVLYHFQGLKYREIAEAMDVPIGTVMSRLHAARLRLRETADLEEAL